MSISGEIVRGWPDPPFTPAEMARNQAEVEQNLATMRDAKRHETPNIWCGDTFVGRSAGVVGRFRRLRRQKNQIHWIAPRYGGLPNYDDDDSEMNGRYTIVLFEARPFEAHVSRGAYTISEILRRNRPRRCEVGDHSGAERHLVLIRGQFAVVWSMCNEHAEIALDHPVRNKEWATIGRAYKSGIDPRSLIGDM